MGAAMLQAAAGRWVGCRTGHLSYFARSQLMRGQGRRCLSMAVPVLSITSCELRPPQGWPEQLTKTPGIAGQLPEIGELLDEADDAAAAQLVAAVLEEVALADVIEC